MTTNTSTKTSLSMKLLIDTKSKKVLFAEASKQVVDFLFTLLQLPLATVIKLLTKEAVVGCLGNLYSSVENLNHDYFQPNRSKDLILNPTILGSSPSISGLLPSSATNHSKITLKFYKCNNHCGCSAVTDVYNSICSTGSCNGRMTTEINYFKATTVDTSGHSNNNNDNGFVKGVITYMIMDDLVIEPMSTISSITMLNRFNIKDVGVLKETVVQLGITEVSLLLPSSHLNVTYSNFVI
ncbi:uncharacterized protein LOC107616233 [Arachis ipaensis]|uniref:uncharacterized protein LOC107616233 n=1 Tax=Arachis ipaensis TaxID=130454 RepID=UPI000A2B490D|nr:uncharacterized protein LOC107616233 [Arachis ipaensis]